MRKSILFTVTFLLGTCFLSAQTHASLDINQIEARVNVSGDLFWDLLGDPHFEAPKNSGKHTLFAGNLWIGGIDGSGQLRLSAQTYRQSGDDFLFGPHAQTYNPAYDQTYNRVWKIEQAEIDFHIAHWSDPGYIPAPIINDWPANGDVSRGEVAQLAPYFDNDNNQQYDPLAGDYPLIRGDQAVFFIYSDNRTPNTESLGIPLQLEIHGMMYGYDNPGDPNLDHTVFIHYDIYNRGADTYYETYIGNWLDFHLGNPFDNYVGSDSMLSAFYGFNADNVDDMQNGYGEDPPAQGFVFLNHRMNSFLTYRNDLSTRGFPTKATDFYGCLSSTWKDGTPVIDSFTNVPTRYMYSGDPVAQQGWTEISSGNLPGIRKGVGVIGPFEMRGGEHLCLDGAYVYFRDSSNTNHLDNVSMMKNRIAHIQNFYDAQSYKNCEILGTTPIERNPPKVNLTVYPNPASDFLFVETTGRSNGLAIELFDLTGRKVLTQNMGNASQVRLSTGSFPGGIYVIVIKNSENQVLARQKVVLE